jgi:pimeloyl-ACP methyl ester carboxylesterase
MTMNYRKAETIRGYQMKTVISRDGTTIAFDKVGGGSAVILVGGALQYRSFDQRTAQLAELLGRNFTTYHYDRRGRGDSGDTQPYAKEREIEDLEALIQEAGGSAMVFAMSSGGALALDAVNRGLKITKLALYEPTFIVDDSRPPVPQDYVERLTGLSSEGRRDEAVEYFMVNGVGIPAEYVNPMRQSPSWAGMEAVAHTLAYDGAFTADFMRGKPLAAQQMASVTVPTLVVDGGETPWLSHAAEAIARALPDGRHLTLKSQPHNVDPAIIAPVLVEFFDSGSRSGLP